ncbi:TonB-dependent siderophore receptor [Acetobacter ascendens]|uniref:Ferrichrome-iron receptor n=1 Tax=Acetobacter ascendens TaxID=481146 RepID=A0A1Y0UY91_9PROT|nr:TonB-dependent siderophore receptor [Acetobacter ascendens]ARW10745.1 Ferrichrome-iron receptor [Acetobacter ascendens]
MEQDNYMGKSCYPIMLAKPRFVVGMVIILAATVPAEARTTNGTPSDSAQQNVPDTTYAKVRSSSTGNPAQSRPHPASPEIISVKGVRQNFLASSSHAGTKTDTPLIETPQSISVITRTQLDARNVQTLSDALAYSPGVRTNIYGFSPRLDQFIIRGFDVTNYGVYRDGLRQPVTPSLLSFRTEPYGLDSITVVNGPASSTYGLSSVGGMVDLETKKPTEKRINEVQFQVGNFSRYQGEFDFSGQLPSDRRFTYRLTGLFRDSDTQIQAVPDNRIYIAPAFTFKPDENTRLTVLTNFQKDRTGGSMFNYQTTEGVLTNIHYADPRWNNLNQTTYRLGYEFEHRFTNFFSFQQNFRYAHGDSNAHYLYISGISDDGTSATRRAGQVREQLNSVGLDNQAKFDVKTGPVTQKILLGVDYLFTDYRTSYADGAAPSLNLITLNYGAQAIPTPSVYSIAHAGQTQVGVYLQDQIRFQRWLLTLSGRHDWVTTNSGNYYSHTSQHQHDDAFSGRVGLTYHSAIGLAPYASYATSFNPTIGETKNGTSFRPITGNQYEVGLKYQPLSQRLLVTAAAFDIHQNHGLMTDPTDPTGIYQIQRGQVRSRGFEVSATGDIGYGFSFNASYTYLDLKTMKGDASTQGKIPSGMPANTASGWLDHTFDSGALKGLGTGFGIRYIGSSFRGDTNATGKNKSMFLMDAAVRYRFEAVSPGLRGLQLAVNLNNLAGRNIVTCQADFCYRPLARTVIGSIRYNW